MAAVVLCHRMPVGNFDQGPAHSMVSTIDGPTNAAALALLALGLVAALAGTAASPEAPPRGRRHFVASKQACTWFRYACFVAATDWSLCRTSSGPASEPGPCLRGLAAGMQHVRPGNVSWSWS